MKRIALAVALWFCLSGLFSTLATTAEDETCGLTSETTCVFTLPESLVEIGESAFENTGAEVIVLPDSLSVIGDRAFADNGRLRMVYIPESVKHIGVSSFTGAHGLIIRGVQGSYADVWAQTHGISFEALQRNTMLITRVGRILLAFSLGCVGHSLQFLQYEKNKGKRRSFRPQDRPELYPINYRFP